MRRRLPSRKTRYGQIETAPEKMHRAAFAAEARTKFFKNAIGLDQNAPETVGIFGIVGTMRFVLIEWNRIGDLVRHEIDFHRNADVAQSVCQFPIKIGYAARLQLEPVVPRRRSFRMRSL